SAARAARSLSDRDPRARHARRRRAPDGGRPGRHSARAERSRDGGPLGPPLATARVAAPQPVRRHAREAALGRALIETLRIEQLAIVESATLEFAPGLNVLTGETGAGKSIVLGALTLLAGGRAAARAVRDGAEQAVVEAVFRTDGLPELARELAERGLTGDEHELIVRRLLAKSGRSRAWVAGQQTPIAALGELFAGRIEISSQHDSQSLLHSSRHAELLDRWAGLDATRARVASEVSRQREIAVA